MARAHIGSDGSLYERATEIVAESGHPDPESATDQERFEAVLRHILKQPKPRKENADGELS